MCLPDEPEPRSIAVPQLFKFPLQRTGTIGRQPFQHRDPLFQRPHLGAQPLGIGVRPALDDVFALVAAHDAIFGP